MPKRPKTYADVLLGGFCQYIQGDPKENPVFCAKKQKDGSPYCVVHHAKCRTPNTKKIKSQYDPRDK